MEFENHFPENLKYLRKEKKLSQEQLGKMLDKDYSTIGKWENGTRSPIMQDTLEICKLFDISLNDLVLKNLRIKGSDSKDK